MKTLYYKYKSNYVKFTSKYFIDINNFNDDKITQALKLSLRKKFSSSIQQYCVDEFKLNIHKCGFCDNYSYIKLEYSFEVYKNSYSIFIKKVKYPNNFYCKEKGCEGKKYNANSIDFVSKSRKINTNEALKIIHNRNKTPFYKKNHKNINEYKKYQSLNSRLNKDKYEEYIKNLKYSKTVDYYIEKYGDKGVEIYEDINKRKDSMSFNFFLIKNNFNYKKSIIEYKNRIKSVTIKNNKFLGGSFSKQSFNFFTKIVYFNNLQEDDIIFGNDEFFIEYYDKKLNKKRKFYYDFIDLKNKVIIEFNGMRWHPNKDKMSTEEYNNWYHPFNKSIKKEELEEKDKLKQKIAKNNNYDYIIIWDSDELNHNLNIISEYYENKKQK